MERTFSASHPSPLRPITSRRLVARETDVTDISVLGNTGWNIFRNAKSDRDRK